MYRSGLVELDAVGAVARLGGFRAAAIELGVSATSISSADAGLEARLGVRLLNRTTRRGALTDDGKRCPHGGRRTVRRRGGAGAIRYPRRDGGNEQPARSPCRHAAP